MYRYIIEDKQHVPPFNTPASELTIGTKLLKLHHEDLMLAMFGRDLALGQVFDSAEGNLHRVSDEAIVYRDNLWFDREFLEAFMAAARRTGRPCRAAFPASDQCFNTYTVPVTKGLKAAAIDGGRIIFMVDLWYFPRGWEEGDPVPIVVPSDAREIGFYSVPDFMKMETGDLTHFAPARAILSIESWVHVYFASIIYGLFGRAGRLDTSIERSAFAKIRLLWRAIIEQRQMLSASGAVEIGEDCDIDPSAIITGPTKIGNRVSIGAGAVIDNCTIGDDVNIDVGCVLKMSTVGDKCFLPFRAALFATAVMESTIIAQNTCLQMCVVGRNSFIGAGSTFTDFNLIAQKPLRAVNRDHELSTISQVVIGSAVGHNCRIGSGMVVFPGRMIESDVVLIASPQRRVISRSVTFEESDHHFAGADSRHPRIYPRADEITELEEMW